jgi:hypothetical protein
MKQFFLLLLLAAAYRANSQQFPNGDFKKWDAGSNCPASWNCNNDADCKGKITLADKIKGGAALTVMHCFDPKKNDRSNNVNISYDDLSAKIPKGKKAKVSFDYTYTPVAEDAAYINIDADFEEEINDVFPQFFYNDSDKGLLKPGSNIHFVCYLNFDPVKGKNYTAPQNCNASSIRTTFGIKPAESGKDVHKGTKLIINHVKFELE